MGMFDAQIVVQSVEKVVAVDESLIAQGLIKVAVTSYSSFDW